MFVNIKTMIFLIPLLFGSSSAAVVIEKREPSSTVAIPPACSGIPRTLEMTAFNWVNSTHNLDCVNPNYPAGGSVCWNSTSLCASGSPGCICTAYCETGTPAVAYQPLGYGPPDTLSITIDGGTCSHTSPSGFRDSELGQGDFDCGSAAQIISFTGNSNKHVGEIGTVIFNAYYASGVSTCDSKPAQYTAKFPLICNHDSGFNATCTTKLPVTLHFDGFFD
jgi:hypothetical protein